MKKLLFSLLLLVFILPSICNAQTTINTSALKIDVGPSLALPIRQLNYVSLFGVGAYGSITTPVIENLDVGGRVSASYFFGKSQYGVSNAGSRIFDVMATGSYLLPQNVFVGIDLGVGFAAEPGFNNTELADSFNVGYQMDYQKHVLRFAVFFDQTTYQKCAGVRATVRL
ncbi:MAG: hypothetical protein JST19_00510 [Bacteroidetes bacterium]|nr:hypothetical protein [Bacteroidota bacterium]